MCSLPVYSHRCCGQPVPPGVSLLRSASAPRSIPRWRGMSPPLHSPQEFQRWSVCVHSCSVPALPGVSQGSAACLRTAQPPGVPKVACACAFLFRASAPGSIPRWRSMSPHPGVSQGSAACLRTAQPPGVPKVACACTFLAVLSFLLVVAAHALTHARASLLARACTRIRARLRMHTCGHTPTSAEKAPGHALPARPPPPPHPLPHRVSAAGHGARAPVFRLLCSGNGARGAKTEHAD